VYTHFIHIFVFSVKEDGSKHTSAACCVRGGKSFFSLLVLHSALLETSGQHSLSRSARADQKKCVFCVVYLKNKIVLFGSKKGQFFNTFLSLCLSVFYFVLLDAVAVFLSRVKSLDN
jgi:hypothetical protein